ncbi:MAG: hypothetical protein K1X89_31055 [Myxococcaceae bacterium]|nr:hypothetical protein [Myxococcaceae bacterium]
MNSNLFRLSVPVTVLTALLAGCGGEVTDLDADPGKPMDLMGADEKGSTQSSLAKAVCVYPWTRAVQARFSHPEVITCGGPYIIDVSVVLASNNGTSASVSEVVTYFYPSAGPHTTAGVQGAGTSVIGPKAAGGSYAASKSELLRSFTWGEAWRNRFDSPPLNYASGQVYIERHTLSGSTNCSPYWGGFADYVVLKKC